MNFRESKPADIEVNLTPLIDVVFLLLIFFMVSTTFIDESEINLTLPQASDNTSNEKPRAIEVNIDARGNVFVDGQRLVNRQSDTLRNALANAAEISLDLPVIISADENTSYQSMVDVMDAARQIGLLRISFATRQRQAQD